MAREEQEERNRKGEAEGEPRPQGRRGTDITSLNLKVLNG